MYLKSDVCLQSVAAAFNVLNKLSYSHCYKLQTLVAIVSAAKWAGVALKAYAHAF